jgi:hypothetical protein
MNPLGIPLIGIEKAHISRSIHRKRSWRTMKKVTKIEKRIWKLNSAQATTQRS